MNSYENKLTPRNRSMQYHPIQIITIQNHVIDNPSQLLHFFRAYPCQNDTFNIQKLQKSQHLKLKIYKEAVYYGEFVNGKKHGLGIMKYNNSRIYEGLWANDFKNGQGYEKFADNCIYKGQFINGKPDGFGKYQWESGQFYQGQWKDGLKNGSGMWKGPKGDNYIGQWVLGKAHGYGVHTWINGDRYQGQFRQNLKHGDGLQKFINGDIYKGNYQNGKPSGFGQYFWKNGSYFKGKFQNGLRNGQGVWKRSQGLSDRYEGQYQNDKKSGYGIFTWASGNIYKGNYNEDLRNGYGQMYWNDGSIYKGNWVNGVQHGEGQLSLPGNGRRKGLFQNNKLIYVKEQQNSKKYLKTEQKINKTDNFPKQRKFEIALKTRLNNQPVKKKDSLTNQPSKRSNRAIDIQHGSNKNRFPTTEDRANSNKKLKISNYSQNTKKSTNHIDRKKLPSLNKTTLQPRKPIKPNNDLNSPIQQFNSKVPKSRLLHSSFGLQQLHARNSITLKDNLITNQTEFDRKDSYEKIARHLTNPEDIKLPNKNKKNNLSGRVIFY